MNRAIRTTLQTNKKYIGAYNNNTELNNKLLTLNPTNTEILSYQTIVCLKTMGSQVNYIGIKFLTTVNTSKIN